MTRTDVVFSFPNGSNAKLAALDGENVSLLSTKAAAPGTPLEGSFEGQGYRIKVRSCRRTEEDAERPFRIDGRLQNLSRAARERLL